jgi:superfamily I DNA and/or RNA helicase
MQYRMNEEIMRFSSDWFYHGQVEPAPEVKYRSILDLDTPMEWVESMVEGETGTGEEETGATAEGKTEPVEGAAPGEAHEGLSLVNKAEGNQALDVLQQYFGRIGKERILEERLDVGIISPYRAQVDYLRRQLRKREFFKPFRHLVTVNTVDGFQGQERDIILISMVRANDEGQIGFLRDLRRMNVAITRARMKLIIVGNAATLTRHPFYRKLYEYIDGVSRFPAQ